MFRFCVLEEAKRTYWYICLAKWFDVAVFPALLALCKRGGRVGFFNGSWVTVNVDGWEHSLDGVRLDVDNHQIGTFFPLDLTVRVEGAGRGHGDILEV